MTILELLDQFYRETDDNVEVQLADLVAFFNDAVAEACRRKELLFDSTTSDVCTFAVTSGTATYSLHAHIVYPSAAYLEDTNGAITYLKIVSREHMGRIDPAWREKTGLPRYLILAETSFTLSPVPGASFTGHLEVFRTPLESEKMTYPEDEDDALSPVIAAQHHDKLYLYCLAQVYTSTPDARLNSDGRAAMQRFADYFGTPLDALSKKQTAVDVPHCNVLW